MSKQNQIFNRNLLKSNINRFSKNFYKSDFLFKEIAHRIFETISEFNQDFEDILEINCRDGFLGKQIIKNRKANLTQTNQINYFNQIYPKLNSIICDDENLCFKEQEFDLIINNLNLHFVNDVISNLSSQKKLLKNNGIFIACFFGGATLKELRDVFYQADLQLNNGIFPRIIPFIDVKTAGSLATKAGFKNVICDSQIIEISYKNLLELLRDIRNMALGNILLGYKPKALSKKMLFLMEKLIKELYPDSPSNSEFVVSFEIITITGF